MSDSVKKAVDEAVIQDFASRIRAKVREKWGPDPNDLPADGELPGSAVPRIVGVETVVQGPPPHPSMMPVPRGLLKRITRQAAMERDELIFVMTLDINGCEVNISYAMSGQAMMLMKAPRASEEIIREMINRGALAAMELLRKGIAEDLLQHVKEKGWDRISEFGMLSLTEAE